MCNKSWLLVSGLIDTIGRKRYKHLIKTIIKKVQVVRPQKKYLEVRLNLREYLYEITHNGNNAPDLNYLKVVLSGVFYFKMIF